MYFFRTFAIAKQNFFDMELSTTVLFACIVMALCCIVCMFVSVLLCVRMYHSADNLDCHFHALRNGLDKIVDLVVSIEDRHR